MKTTDLFPVGPSCFFFNDKGNGKIFHCAANLMNVQNCFNDKISSNKPITTSNNVNKEDFPRLELEISFDCFHTEKKKKQKLLIV